MARSSVDNGLDPLYVGLPGTIGASVGVGDLDPEGYALTTKITLRHSLHLLSVHQFVTCAQALVYNIRQCEKMQVFFYDFFDICCIFPAPSV